MKPLYLALGLLGLLFTACQSSDSSDHPVAIEKKAPANDYVAALEKAHKVDHFHQKEVVSFDIDIKFGGKPYGSTHMSSKTNSGKIRMTRKADKAELLFDGHDVWLHPDTADWGRGRFDIFTWQYFFQAPYKLSDPGTKWELLGVDSLNGQAYELAKLSFEGGTGDAPDDWYILFKDPQTNLLHAMAYIVTYSRSQEEAEKSPSLILYSNYKDVDGIPVAQDWTFYKWNREEGITGEARGHGQVRQVQFEKELAATFDMPGGKLVEK
ncbi:MAG: heat-shock protein Hsp90 [Bacteroidota bacterium]